MFYVCIVYGANSCRREQASSRPIISISMTSLLLLDMCLYKKDNTGDLTPIYPPDDLDYDRVKSLDDDSDGEWRLVTVEYCHVFNHNNKNNTQQHRTGRVKGYGRITVLEKHPSEVFYEFAFWNVPECNADMPPDANEQEPFWDSRDVHWQHTWQALHHHD